MFTCRQPITASLPQPQFSSSLELEARLKKCAERTNAAVSALASSVYKDKGMEWSAEHQRLFTHALAVLASLPAHAELAKAERVQKQACELCKCLVAGIKRLAERKALFHVYDERVGAVLAQLLVQEVYRPYRTSFALSDVLWVFGEMCVASPSMLACADERSASHQIASLCEQENKCPGVQKHAQIALCKLLYMGADEHFVFQSRFVDLLMHRTILAPDDVECTPLVLTVLCTMQEKNERALEYIWKQSPVSRVLADVLSSNPCPENTSKIMCLLRFPATKPELRMLLARSGVWEVFNEIVARGDVNNMTLQRFAEVFQHFAVCPDTGPLLVGLDAHHILITALRRVKNDDAATADKLLLCAYNCCKENKGFGAKIAASGMLGKMHDMSVRARLYTLSIVLARYTATCDGQHMEHILAREVHLLTGILLVGKAPRCGLPVQHEDGFIQEWVRFVHDVRDSDIRALAPKVVQDFSTALLANTDTANVWRGPALHLLARMLSCRSDVRLRAHDVRTLADQELPYTRATACTGLLALAGALYHALNSAAGAAPDANASGSGGSGGQNSRAEAGAEDVATVPDSRQTASGSGGTAAKRQNSRVEAGAEDVATVPDSRQTAITTVMDNANDSEDSTHDLQADDDICKIGLTTNDLQCIEDAFPHDPHVLGMLLRLWPVFSPAGLGKLPDMFLAAYKGKRSQRLLVMHAMDALLPWFRVTTFKLVCHCGLDQLWNTVEKGMPHCEQQASVKFTSTFRRVCLLARQENEQHVLDTLLTLPFYAALLAHLERTVAGHELELAHALVSLLHTVLDVQAAAAGELLLGGAAFKLVRVRDALASAKDTGACLHKEISRVVQRIVPEQHAALLGGFAQTRKRKLAECVRGESVQCLIIVAS